MKLTKRQKAYREYLESEHWKALRRAAIVRDGGKCVTCGSREKLQVHHLKYRGQLEDGLLEDVETLCRKHHRLEHGLGPTDFQEQLRVVEGYFCYQKRPPVAAWKELKALIDCREDLEDFGDLMFRWIRYVMAHEQEKGVSNWWMDKAKNDYWFNLAYEVRQSIKERAQTYVW